MGLRISTNVSSIASQRFLESQQSKVNHASAAIASGSRIVQSSDDAAGLAISENFKGNLKGLAQAKANANNAISFAQVGEGALSEVSNILIRLKELSVQAASGTVADEERGFIDKEAQQLLSEVDRISKTTSFGSRKLLDGSGGEVEVRVGSNAEEGSLINFNFDASATTSDLGIDGLSVGDMSDAQSALEKVDKALQKVSGMRAGFGATQSRLESASNTLDVSYENLSAANSRIRDADIAKETSELASANILRNTAVSILAQANQEPNIALKLL